MPTLLTDAEGAITKVTPKFGFISWHPYPDKPREHLPIEVFFTSRSTSDRMTDNFGVAEPDLTSIYRTGDHVIFSAEYCRTEETPWQAADLSVRLKHPNLQRPRLEGFAVIEVINRKHGFMSCTASEQSIFFNRNSLYPKTSFDIQNILRAGDLVAYKAEPQRQHPGYRAVSVQGVARAPDFDPNSDSPPRVNGPQGFQENWMAPTLLDVENGDRRIAVSKEVAKYREYTRREYSREMRRDVAYVQRGLKPLLRHGYGQHHCSRPLERSIDRSSRRRSPSRRRRRHRSGSSRDDSRRRDPSRRRRSERKLDDDRTKKEEPIRRRSDPEVASTERPDSVEKEKATSSREPSTATPPEDRCSSLEKEPPPSRPPVRFRMKKAYPKGTLNPSALRRGLSRSPSFERQKEPTDLIVFEADEPEPPLSASEMRSLVVSVHLTRQDEKSDV